MDKASKRRFMKEQVWSTYGYGGVLAAVSGGADSTALLSLLASAPLRGEMPLEAVHCNFHLRGEESDRDMRFVEELCRKYDIPLHVVHFDVEAYRKEHGGSVEMACRELRYAEFRRLKDEKGLSVIAVAHNYDDNIETIMLNLLRGTGIKGLCGMSYYYDGIVRPLLNFSRSDIEEYLAEEGLDFITDSTNLESEYRRNFLRNEVIPLIETRWPDFKATIHKMSKRMEEDFEVLNWYEAGFIHIDPITPGVEDIPYFRLEKEPHSLWIIEKFARDRGANKSQCKEIFSHLIALLDEKNSYPGKSWKVKEGMIVSERDRLTFIPDSVTSEDTPPFKSEKANVNERIFKTIKESGLEELWLPAGVTIHFRHPQKGDRITPIGMSGSTLVSKILKDAKATAVDKKNIWLAVDADTGEVLWLQGLKRSRLHLVTPETPIAIHYYLSKY